jgi:hypothetical protein
MPDYPVGPGHARTTGGAVVEAYVDTNALDYECPACGAAVAEFCRWDTGRQRRMPCPQRITAAAKGADS